MCSAEQECQLTQARVDDPHHLDQNPGFMVKGMGAERCDETSKLTFEECKEARFSLDEYANDVKKTNEISLPTGCYRQQKEEYRFRHSESSYVWYFNEASEGQSDSISEPVCKGKADLFVRILKIVIDRFACILTVCRFGAQSVCDHKSWGQLPCG